MSRQSSSAFFIPSTPSSRRSSLASDDFSSLPFPQPLVRSAFTAPDFSAAAYLSTLHNRHQTLEDLRSDLRNRSKDLEKELIELINAEYVDFVGLGGSLKGGEGKVADLKVGIMGFVREVEGVKSRLVGVVRELESGLKEKSEVTKKKTLARNLLAFSNHLSILEALLLLDTSADSVSTAFMFDTEPSASSSEMNNILTTTPRLQKLVSTYLHLQLMLSRLPPTHPYIIAQSPRIKLTRKTILEDLASATRECRVRDGASAEVKKEREGKLLKVLRLWEAMGETALAVKILRESSAGSKKYIG